MRKEKIAAKLWLCIAIGLLIAAPAHTTTLRSDFSWIYKNQHFSISCTFDKNIYTHYKNIEREYDDFTFYLHESPGFPVVETIADQFRSIAAENNFSDKQTAECVIAFVQNMKYINDGTYEYPRYPVETIIDKGGDCEDTAILLDAILRALGVDCVLLSPAKHMGVGIAMDGVQFGTSFPYAGKQYFYVETTSNGWEIGDYPAHLSDQVTVLSAGDNADLSLLSENKFSFTGYIATNVECADADTAFPVTLKPLVHHALLSEKPDDTVTSDVNEKVIASVDVN